MKGPYRLFCITFALFYIDIVKAVATVSVPNAVTCGSDAIVRCDFSGSFVSSASRSWIKNATAIIVGGNSANSSKYAEDTSNVALGYFDLTIKNFVKSDEGLYSCQYGFYMASTEVSCTDSVHTPVTMSVPIAVTCDSDAIVRCHFTGSFVSCESRHWMKNATAIVLGGNSANSSKYAEDTSNVALGYFDLTIKNFVKSDEGLYSCQYGFDMASTEVSCTDSAHAPVTVSVPIAVTCDSDAIVRCHFTVPFYAVVSRSWIKNATAIIVGGSSANSSKYAEDTSNVALGYFDLTIKNFVKSDEGLYSCQYGFYMASTEVSCTGYVKAQVSLTVVTTSPTCGTSVTLRCALSTSFDSTIGIQWERDSVAIAFFAGQKYVEDLSHTDRGYVDLVITDFGPQDSGSYGCTYGFDSSSEVDVRCTSKNSYGQSGLSLIEVTTPPTCGTNLALRCVFDASFDPASTRMWAKDGNTIVASGLSADQKYVEDLGHINQGYFDLIIKDFGPHDAGSYRCIYGFDTSAINVRCTAPAGGIIG